MKATFRAVAIAAILGVGLGGCLRPLYGSSEFGGLAVDQALKGVRIELEGERLAHYLRNELEFNLRGGAPGAAAVTHRLTISTRQVVQAALVDRLIGAAESATIQIDASYTLYPVGKTVAATQGEARAIVSYDRGQQRFATIRSARDAEILGARQLADQIRTRVAAYLAAQR